MEAAADGEGGFHPLRGEDVAVVGGVASELYFFHPANIVLDVCSEFFTTTTETIPTASTTPAPSTTAVATELVVNGSFELPDVPAGEFSLLEAIPGWSLSFGSAIEVHDTVSGSPFDGTQHVELDSTENSGIYQDLPTENARTYVLSFAYSPRPERTADDNSISVYWDGELVADWASPGWDSLTLSGPFRAWM
jgi:hypothetical protein